MLEGLKVPRQPGLCKSASTDCSFGPIIRHPHAGVRRIHLEALACNPCDSFSVTHGRALVGHSSMPELKFNWHHAG